MKRIVGNEGGRSGKRKRESEREEVSPGAKRSKSREGGRRCTRVFDAVFTICTPRLSDKISRVGPSYSSLSQTGRPGGVVSSDNTTCGLS